MENIQKNLEIELLIWEFIYKENQGVKDSVLFFILTKYQMISTALHDHMTVIVTYPQKRIGKSSILATEKVFWKSDFSKGYWYTKHTKVSTKSFISLFTVLYPFIISWYYEGCWQIKTMLCVTVPWFFTQSFNFTIVYSLLLLDLD